VSTDNVELPVLQASPRRQARLGRDLWVKLRRTVGRVPFIEDVVAAWYCAIDSQTPTYVRGILLGAVAYFVLPTDMVPDFLVGLGFTDDASVIAAAIAAVGRNLRPEHRERARETIRTHFS
jgi:uncharacterized membrane protein YkvA (DUF1232 family)